jgi:hypothetical protein
VAERVYPTGYLLFVLGAFVPGLTIVGGSLEAYPLSIMMKALKTGVVLNGMGPDQQLHIAECSVGHLLSQPFRHWLLPQEVGRSQAMQDEWPAGIERFGGAEAFPGQGKVGPEENIKLWRADNLD